MRRGGRSSCWNRVRRRGVLAAGFTAKRLGIENVITLDMGGTTAKASMIEGGKIDYSPEYEVGSSLSVVSRLVGGGGELIRAPSIDIAEVGAGGGSIAYLDKAGGLRVGPRSAGAVPGPVCYQRGGQAPTLTDANVVLGYIRPGDLADGQVSIDRESSERAITDQIATPLGPGSHPGGRRHPSHRKCPHHAGLAGCLHRTRPRPEKFRFDGVWGVGTDPCCGVGA